MRPGQLIYVSCLLLTFIGLSHCVLVLSLLQCVAQVCDLSNYMCMYFFCFLCLEEVGLRSLRRDVQTVSHST